MLLVEEEVVGWTCRIFLTRKIHHLRFCYISNYPITYLHLTFFLLALVYGNKKSHNTCLWTRETIIEGYIGLMFLYILAYSNQNLHMVLLIHWFPRVNINIYDATCFNLAIDLRAKTMLPCVVGRLCCCVFLFICLTYNVGPNFELAFINDTDIWMCLSVSLVGDQWRKKRKLWKVMMLLLIWTQPSKICTWVVH